MCPASRWIISPQTARPTFGTYPPPVAIVARLATTSATRATCEGALVRPADGGITHQPAIVAGGRAASHAPARATSAMRSLGSTATATGAGDALVSGPASATHWARPTDQPNAAAPTTVVLTIANPVPVTPIDAASNVLRSGGRRRMAAAPSSIAETDRSG